MPTLKLTETTVARLRAPTDDGKQKLFWDKELKGFGVLCSGVTNSKTYVAQRALPNGNTRRVTIAAVNETTLKEARDEAAATLLDMRRGRDPKAQRRHGMTVRQVLDEYLEANNKLRPKSRDGYRGAVEQWLWPDHPLREVTSDMVEKRHREIQKKVAAGGRYSGHATANGAMRALRVLWNFAAERDATMGPNPVRRRWRQWFPVPRRERSVKADDLHKFYRAVCALPNPVHRDYLLLLLFTGLRRSEAAALTWKDVDIAAETITIPAAGTKAGRKLTLPMSNFVKELFVARKAIGRAQHVFLSNAKSKHIEEPKFALRLVAAACGVRVSPHDLRRTFITVAESCEISPMALKAMVNHSLGGDVTAGYVQMTTERLRAPVQKVADEMKRLCRIGDKKEPGGFTSRTPHII